MKRDRALLLAIVVIGFVLRVAVTVSWRDRLAVDVDGYRGIAEMLAGGHGFANPVTKQPTAFRPPLYPVVLAAGMLIAPEPLVVASVNVLFGTLTVLLAGWLALRVSLRPFWLVPLAVAVDPLMLAYTPQVMTEVTSALTIAALLCACPQGGDSSSIRRAFGCGILFGLAALCRPVIWAVLPLIPLVLWTSAFRPHLTPSRIVRGLMAFGMGAVLLVAPWLVRNQIVLGRPVFATTHGGYTLLLANNPEFYREVVRAPWGKVWDSRAWQARVREQMAADGIDLLDEVEADRWLYRRGVANISADPGGFLHACWVRLRRLWNIVPVRPEHSRVVNVGVGVFNSFILGGVLLTLVRDRLRGAPVFGFALACLLAFSLVHAVYWTNTRMRAPLVVPIALLSARGWAGLWRGADRQTHDVK